VQKVPFLQTSVGGGGGRRRTLSLLKTSEEVALEAQNLLLPETSGGTVTPDERGGGRNECSFGCGRWHGEGNGVDEKRSDDAERDGGVTNEGFAAGLDRAGVCDARAARE
jgi:hypothetical protein